MERKPITADVVEEIDRLLAQKVDPATISGRLGVTEYVVRVIDGDLIGKGRRLPRGRSNDRVVNRSEDVDAITVRRIRRMLDVGWLNHRQIAREAGVLASTVSRVAHGARSVALRRDACADETHAVFREPIRCSGCGATISFAPCQACYARFFKTIHLWEKTNSPRIPGLAFGVARFFDLLLKYLKRTRGAKTMQDVTSTLSTEIAALIAAKDKREYVISRVEKLFDEAIEPIDLPGPDGVVDPLLRAAIRPLVGRIYDELLKKLEAPVANAA